MSTVPARECPRCHRPAYEGLFCQYDGVFLLDQEGTVIMATRLSRLGAAIAEARPKLDELRSQNLITESEYQEKRKAILDRL